MKKHFQQILILFLAVILFAPLILVQGQERQLRQSAGNEKNKIALVIGNGAYKNSPLRNPVNDASDMARELKMLGFEVLSYTDLDQNEMKRAIREFGRKLKNDGGIGLFYYAGHGVQVKGVNYLIPVDAQVASEEEVEYEAVEAGFALAQMEAAGNPMNIVILDACRNNPFARSYRSADKGLAQMNAPSGTLIAYSTAPGSVAADGKGENGVYTAELLKKMKTPNLSIEDVFKQVRIAVRSQTQGKQTPWESSSLTGYFYFVQNGQNKTEHIVQETKTIEPKPRKNIGEEENKDRIAKEKFFTFNLKQCRISGTTVACDLTITNNESNERLLRFYQRDFGAISKIFDNQGNEAKMSGNEIANRGSYQEVTMLPDVSVKAKAVFNGVSSDAEELKLVTFYFSTIKNGYIVDSFKIEYKNVPLLR